MEAVDTEFQDCMAAMVRKFPGSEEARRAEAGRRCRTEPGVRGQRRRSLIMIHVGMDSRSIRSIKYFRNIGDFLLRNNSIDWSVFFLFFWFVHKNQRQIHKLN